MSDDSILEDLLDRWEEARELGQPVPAEELCRDCPELLQPLRKQIAALEDMAARMATRLEPEAEETVKLPEKEEMPVGPLRVLTEFADIQYHDGGGLGVVFRARDEKMHRDVALKFVRRRFAADEESRTRFLLEAEVTSRLDHPGIIPVHGVGETSDQRLFYAMRFVNGQTFGEVIDEYHQSALDNDSGPRAIQFRNLLSRLVSVCRTVAYAHNRGIVHRDLKPANILLGRYGETLVADWGLALPVGREAQFRVTGEHTLMPRSDSGKSTGTGGGTPAYMSPEQHADTSDIKPATDIYSLGAILYKILTGRTPVDKCRSYDQIKSHVLGGRIPKPSDVTGGKKVPGAVEAICLKAMALDPRDRYATAMDLADDIEQYLADEPVSAYREPRSERLVRWLRRHRSGTLVGLVGIAAVLVVTIGASVWLAAMARRESRAREHAETMTFDVARTNARLAARTMANDIKLRLVVLQEDARDPELRRLVADYNATRQLRDEGGAPTPAELDARKKVQDWLLDRQRTRQPLAGRGNGGKAKDWASIWYVYDKVGTQVARIPYKDRKTGEVVSSIGENFAYRTYFSGRKDRDLPVGSKARPHEHKAHMAAVYQSVVDDRYKASFTVPVYAVDEPDGRPIGILGLTLDLGAIAAVDIPHVSLIDLREDYLDEGGSPSRGLILHHEGLGKTLEARRAAGGKSPLPRVDWKLLEAMQRVHFARANGQTLPDVSLRPFPDPLTNGERTYPTAFEPVIVEGDWPDHVRNTRWIVMVQIRED